MWNARNRVLQVALAIHKLQSKKNYAKPLTNSKATKKGNILIKLILCKIVLQ